MGELLPKVRVHGLNSTQGHQVSHAEKRLRGIKGGGGDLQLTGRGSDFDVSNWQGTRYPGM